MKSSLFEILTVLDFLKKLARDMNKTNIRAREMINTVLKALAWS